MTIDEADTILSCERLDSCMGCGASDEDIDKALGVAIETMRKYQKIEQIVNNNPDYVHHTDMNTYKVNSIKEVIEDG